MNIIRLTRTLTGPLLVALVLVTTSLATPVRAEDPQPLAILLESFKVQNGPDGKEILVSAATARPGDTLVYVATYHNQINTPLGNVKGVIPIPADMEYLPGSAEPEAAEASTDGKSFAPLPLKRKVQLASGKIEERDIPYKEYRALRWHLGTITPDQKVQVKARARLTIN